MASSSSTIKHSHRVNSSHTVLGTPAPELEGLATASASPSGRREAPASAQAVEHRGELGGSGSSTATRLAGDRVREAERAGVQERAVELERRRGARRRRRRPPPGGRWPGGAPGSGGCGRSRAGTSSSDDVGRRGTPRAPRRRCAPSRPPSRTAMRVGRRTDRPIGASITPRGDVGHAPHERDVVGARRRARRASRRGSSYAAGVRATTSRPLVSRSRRCTMPGRAGSPTPRELRVAREQAVHERAVGVARARVHDEPGRLGDHEHVVVLVAHHDRRSHGSASGSAAARPARRGARSRSPASSLRLFGDRLRRRRAPRPPSTSSCTSPRSSR